MCHPSLEKIDNIPRLRGQFLGTGYLGTTCAISFVQLGYQVLGVDVDPAKVEKLNAGIVPFHAPWAPATVEPGRPNSTRSSI